MALAIQTDLPFPTIIALVAGGCTEVRTGKIIDTPSSLAAIPIVVTRLVGGLAAIPLARLTLACPTAPLPFRAGQAGRAIAAFKGPHPPPSFSVRACLTPSGAAAVAQLDTAVGLTISLFFEALIGPPITVVVHAVAVLGVRDARLSRADHLHHAAANPGTLTLAGAYTDCAALIQADNSLIGRPVTIVVLAVTDLIRERLAAAAAVADASVDAPLAGSCTFDTWVMSDRFT